jgi:hypothetical protein
MPLSNASPFSLYLCRQFAHAMSQYSPLNAVLTEELPTTTFLNQGEDVAYALCHSANRIMASFELATLLKRHRRYLLSISNGQRSYFCHSFMDE